MLHTLFTGKKRWLMYTPVGLAFGVMDWYYLERLAHFPWGGLGDNLIVVPIIIVLNFGIWLAPVIPITLNEIRIPRSTVRASLYSTIVKVT
jgi:hypothetical protein